MQLKEFDYDVFVMVEISGRELLFLQNLSFHHYDGTCKAAGAIGGFLYGFIQRWITASDDQGEWPENKSLDRIEFVRMSGHQLGILGKICEVKSLSSSHLLDSHDFFQLLKAREYEYARLCKYSKESESCG